MSVWNSFAFGSDSVRSEPLTVDVRIPWTQRVRWRVPARRPTVRWATEAVLLSVDREGSVMARDTRMGVVRWSRIGPPDAQSVTDFASSSSTAVLAMRDSAWALDLTDGHTLMRVAADGISTVGASRHGFVIGDVSGARGIDLDGTLRWQQRVSNMPPLGDDQRVPPTPVQIVPCGAVAMVDSGLQVAAHDWEHGRELWTRPGAALLACGPDVAVVHGAGVLVLESQDGRVRWQSTALRPSAYAPFPIYRHVAVGTDATWMLGIDAILGIGFRGGGVRLTYGNEPALAYATIALTGQRVVARFADDLLVIDASTGEHRGTIDVAGSNATLTAGGGAAFVEIDREIVALDLE